MNAKFSLSCQDCEILLQFEQTGNLLKLSQALGKDISVVSRNLKAIGEQSDVLEKKNGRWSLTSIGRELNVWTREAILSQKMVLNAKKSLVIATTREFASRILIPAARELIGDENVSISIISTDEGIEQYLVSGKADFGFDCGTPNSKLVAYKKMAAEPFSLVAAPKYIKRLKIKDHSQLLEYEKLKFSRMANSILDTDINDTKLNATFNDISILRSACIEGFGWTILPTYSIKNELREKKLQVIPGAKLAGSSMGIWWMKDRAALSPWIEKATYWLKQQESILGGA